MGNFTNTCQDVRNLTCRPRDNLTFRKELERQCHIQMLILLFAAFTVGCLLIITVRAINKYWCSLGRRRVFRPIPERWSLSHLLVKANRFILTIDGWLDEGLLDSWMGKDANRLWESVVRYVYKKRGLKFEIQGNESISR